MRTIALYTTETMADWEYAYLTTQIVGAEQLKPGRFQLLLVGDGLEQIFLNAREDDYMALMEATSAWQNPEGDSLTSSRQPPSFTGPRGGA